MNSVKYEVYYFFNKFIENIMVNLILWSKLRLKISFITEIVNIIFFVWIVVKSNNLKIIYFYLI